MIILPSILFVAFFVFLMDLCPVFEEVIKDAAGDMFTGDVKQLLTCPSPRPLLEYMDIGLNYTKVINEVDSLTRGHLDSSFDALQSSYLDGFGEYTVGADTQTLTHPISVDVLFNRPGAQFTTAEAAGCTATGLSYLKDWTIEQNGIDKIKELNEKIETIFKIGDTQKGLEKRSADLSAKTDGIVDEFKVEALEWIEEGFSNLTCEPVKCVYAPVRNAVCQNILEGMAFWVISSMLLIAGLGMMEVSFCARRRKMQTAQTQDDDDGSLEEAPSKRRGRGNYSGDPL
jgi:hypothetical protein